MTKVELTEVGKKLFGLQEMVCLMHSLSNPVTLISSTDEDNTTGDSSDAQRHCS